MSKQTQTPPTPSSNANTAEHGCGNGFSLIQALSTPSPSNNRNNNTASSSSSSTTSQSHRMAPPQQQQPGGMSRAELLSILQDVLEITAGDVFENDLPLPPCPSPARDYPASFMSQ